MKNYFLLVFTLIAITVGLLTIQKNVSAQTSCATIQTISSNVQSAKIGDTFLCQVDVDSQFASSPNIACGLSINGGFPQNVCPSDTSFGGWQGNRARFNCTVPTFNSTISSLELVAYDFRPECGVQTGKRLALSFLNETPSINPQPNNTTSPVNPNTPSTQPIDPDRVPSPWAKDPNNNDESPTNPLDKTVQPLQNLFKIIFGNFTTNPSPSASVTNSPPASNISPPATNPQVSPNPATPVTPNDSFQTIQQLIKYTSDKTTVPYCVLERVAMIEYGSIFSSYTPQEIVAGSVPGQVMRNCPNNSCSATGVMQMTTGRDSFGSTTCSQCCWQGSCLKQCPNAWAGYGKAVNTYEGSNHIPNACNIKDNIFGAAEKLKLDSKNISATWTDARIHEAAKRFFGNCTVAVINGKTYCQVVIDHCKL